MLLEHMQEQLLLFFGGGGVESHILVFTGDIFICEISS